MLDHLYQGVQAEELRRKTRDTGCVIEVCRRAETAVLRLPLEIDFLDLQTQPITVILAELDSGIEIDTRSVKTSQGSAGWSRRIQKELGACRMALSAAGTVASLQSASVGIESLSTAHDDGDVYEIWSERVVDAETARLIWSF